MVDFVDTGEIAQLAKAIYAERLRVTLERDHLNEFVAIEPDSGDFFLGDSLTEAIRARESLTRIESRTRCESDMTSPLKSGVANDRRLEVNYRTLSVLIEQTA